MTTSNVEELMSHFMAMIDAMNGVAPGVAPPMIDVRSLYDTM